MLPNLRKESFGALSSYCIEDDQQQLQIISDLGGLLNSYRLRRGEGDWIALISGYPSGESAQKGVTHDYRGAKLSPVPNRTEGGRYEFQGKPYLLEKNFGDRHHIHGFMSHRPMERLRSGANDKGGAFLSLYCTYEGEEPGYPFPYLLQVDYELQPPLGFRCTTTLQNKGKSAMPIGDGWHPYFQLGGQEVGELSLQLPAGMRLKTNEEMIPTGAREAFGEFSQPKPIGTTHFDDGFQLTPAQRATTRIMDTATGLGMEIWQEAQQGQYSYLQVYTPEDRKSIAIEPMSCPANALNSREGLIELASGERWTASWGLTPLLPA